MAELAVSQMKDYLLYIKGLSQTAACAGLSACGAVSKYAHDRHDASFIGDIGERGVQARVREYV